jgi:lysophospholipase L1-like esterase
MPLFIENPANPHYILPRPDLVKRYFAEEESVPQVTMEANFLLKDKPKDGLRIFVQGGSSAAGFPYGLGASIAGMLEPRLKRTFPDNYVEVVNTAMAAVNSYTLLDITDEIIEQQPDAVLIYAGHNEYLGILGVGSNYTAANSSGTTLLFLKLKEYRTFQLVQQLYKWFKSEEQLQNQGESSRTFMSKVAKHKNIPYGSELYQAGLNQFETNLGLILSKYQAANVPVFIATIASNEKDLTPFSSAQSDSSLKQQSVSFANTIKSGQTVAPNQLNQFSQQILASDSADLNFHLAALFYASENFLKAQQHFVQAKELDLLRFRAPEGINTIVRSQAKQHGAIVVEAQKRLRSQSKQGIIGHNVMLEHLHMNVQGYFVLADEFYQSLKQHQQFGKWQDVAIQDAWKMRPILPAEEYNGFAKVTQLMSDYPFTDTPKPLRLPKPADWQQKLGEQQFLKQINWLQMMQKSHARYKATNQVELADKTLRLLAEALPHESKVNLEVAKRLQQNGEPQLAATYYRRAILAGDTSESTRNALATIQLR